MCSLHLRCRSLLGHVCHAPCTSIPHVFPSVKLTQILIPLPDRHAPQTQRRLTRIAKVIAGRIVLQCCSPECPVTAGTQQTKRGSPDTALAKPILGAEPGWLPFCVSGKDDDMAADGPRNEGARLGFCPSDICPRDGKASARAAPVRQTNPKSENF